MKKLVIAMVLLVTFSACKTPEARRPISVKTGSFIDQSVERNKKLIAEEHAIIKTLIEADTNTEYLASPNGFWYTYNTKVQAESGTPGFGDLVNFDYDIKDLKGNTIYTQEQLRTQNYAMDQQELFSGLREGLKLMKAGETVTFLFPSQKAYGYYGDSKSIGTNVPLVCQVTVNTITQKETN
ncbi:MAG: gliding motility-associated peptidyl-prolyl isomerase GldI [Flavobacteriaceae bacterium]|nr:gliding motility-associated peptidyl-prolyl isomerase GldI [Flavobacteriaceae bacterium]RZV67838.1 MAG: gliding motility-associated peptidyl-prolyl isomerase GldI [Flavobacteriaceae bacterium]